MYGRIKALYDEGKITAKGVYFWVTKGVITIEQYNNIVGEIIE